MTLRLLKLEQQTALQKAKFVQAAQELECEEEGLEAAEVARKQVEVRAAAMRDQRALDIDFEVKVRGSAAQLVGCEKVRARLCKVAFWA